MSKKKLTILIDWYLPGTKAGGPVRSIFSLIALLKDEFEIRVITTNCDLGKTKPYENIVANEWIKKDDVLYYYFSKENLTKQNLKRLLIEINSEVIYLNSFWSYWFSIYIVQLKNQGVLNANIVLAPRGMLGKGALTIKPIKKKAYLFISKIRNFYKHIRFHATNPQELTDIKRVYNHDNITIIQNVNSTLPTNSTIKKQEGELKLFYLSRISPIKNLHLALELLSQISSDYQISYNIYGNIEDEIYWKKCELIITNLPKHIQVKYCGEIAFEKVQDQICKQHCLLLPTANENFGHSIVESLMSGCPAIISDQTPWTDLREAEAGDAINLNDKTHWIKTIEYYAKLNDVDYQKASKNAQNYISKKINLPLIKQNYKQLFNATR